MLVCKVNDTHTKSYVSKLWKTPQEQRGCQNIFVRWSKYGRHFMEPGLGAGMMAIAIGDFLKEIG